MATHRDPKDIVTPHAFRVAPELLGLPLAGPARRAAAMFVDLSLIGALLLLKEISGTLFGLVCAWALFRVSSRTATEGVTGPFRVPLRVVAVLVLIVTAAALAGSFIARFGPDSAPRPVPLGEPSSVEAQLRDAGLSLADVGRGLADAVALRRAATPAEAEPAARRLVAALARAGVPPEEAREVLEELLSGEGQRPWRREVVERAVLRAAGGAEPADAPAGEPAGEVGAGPESRGGGQPGGEPGGEPGASHARADLSPADSLSLAYAEAHFSGDTAAARELRPRLAEAVAGEELAALRRERARLRRQLAAARERPAESPGIFSFLRGIARDLGLGLGWAGLYFTVFLAVWRGQTPGKRLLGLRVVHLNGEPLGWWSAFGRFGGYAASLATGLLGFLQIFWDANRQGLHDKVVGTVVIRTSAGRTAPR